MEISLALRTGPRLNPLSVLAAVLVFVGVFGFLRDRVPLGRGPMTRCDPVEDAFCEEDEGRASGTARGTGRGAGPAGPVLEAAQACRGVGYLCADLTHTDRVRMQRWRDFSGTMVVHVPRPDFEDLGEATRLQAAAARGIRAWNSSPFPIRTDLRGDRGPHFAVRWTRGLGGSQIGVARTQWSSSTGLTVVSIELTTRSPFGAGGLIDSRQVQLTAAHEMGHALGLPHSDSPRDVMYPTNTASSLSAQDYRTMEALYQLEDGTEIVR